LEEIPDDADVISDFEDLVEDIYSTEFDPQNVENQNTEASIKFDIENLGKLVYIHMYFEINFQL